MEKKTIDGVEYVLYTIQEHKKLQEMVLEQRELINHIQVQMGDIE